MSSPQFVKCDIPLPAKLEFKGVQANVEQLRGNIKA